MSIPDKDLKSFVGKKKNVGCAKYDFALEVGFTKIVGLGSNIPQRYITYLDLLLFVYIYFFNTLQITDNRNTWQR